MFNKLKYILLFCCCIGVHGAFAQIINPNQQSTSPYTRPDTGRRAPARIMSDAETMDSLRKKEENKHDSVIFTSKFIRVTNERLLSDSTQVLPLDTGLVNFENYSPLYQPKHPKIGLGSL